MPTTTWTTEGTGTSGWTTASGQSIQSNTAITTYGDNEVLYFGTDSDFGIMYDTTDTRLEINNNLGTRIASLSATGLYLDQVNFLELPSLPGSATEGRMVYYNNEYYLGIGS